MPYVQEGPGGDPGFAHSPLGRLFGYGEERPARISRTAATCGLMLVAVSGLVIVLVLVGCQGEGGAYCSMYGHPEPWLRKIYTVHAGEYGDLMFGAAQLALILSLLSFGRVRDLLARRCWTLWPRRACWHWLLLLLLVAVPPCGGLLNRIRGGWLGDEGWVNMASSEGDLISRLSLSAGTLVLVTLLSGGNLGLGFVFFFWMWWAEMLGWGCYFGMAHGAQPKPGTHGDCAGLDRHGMYDWLLGTTVATWPHARRLRRDWVGMWLRGLNWLGPPGLATAAAGYSTSVIACGAMLPAVYNADVWWVTGKWLDAHHFSTGSPFGELTWGMYAWFSLLVTFMGSRQEAQHQSAATSDMDGHANGPPRPPPSTSLQAEASTRRLRRGAAVTNALTDPILPDQPQPPQHQHSYGIRSPSFARSDDPEVPTVTAAAAAAQSEKKPGGGLWRSCCVAGWGELTMPRGSRSLPQRLYSLLERLVWLVGVVQSICSAVLCVMVAIENGRHLALLCVAIVVVVAALCAPRCARTWVQLRGEVEQDAWQAHQV